MGVKAMAEMVIPFVAMILVETFDVGMTTLSKAAMSRGLSHYIFVAYSNSFASLLLLPSSLLLTRNNRPPLTFSLVCKFFFLSLIGITIMQNCVYTGVNYSSPTLGSAMSNLIPAFTFLLSVFFRMEKLDLGSTKSLIKIMGTLLSICGALIVTLYKGTAIASVPIQSHLSPNSSHQQSLTILESASNWVLGGLFFVVAGLSFSIWNISQAAILKGYPSGITIVSFYCFFGAIQSAIVALIAEGADSSAWALKLDIKLVAIIYSAVFGSIITYNVQTWCIEKKGPVFVALFKPVGIGIAALMSVIFLGEKLYAGSIIGAVIIVIGFYAVIWSQSREEKNDDEGNDTLPLQSEKSPLLQSKSPTDF